MVLVRCPCRFWTPWHIDLGNGVFGKSYIHLDHIFYQVQKYSKLLTNGPSTCRDITQNSDFEKSKIAYNCVYIVNCRNRKFTVSEKLQCKCSYKRFFDFSKSLFWVMSPHVEGPISTGS